MLSFEFIYNHSKYAFLSYFHDIIKENHEQVNELTSYLETTVQVIMKTLFND